MHRTKSTDPTDRLGVFKRYDDVPTHHRFSSFTDDYAGRDVWGEFCERYEYHQGSGDRFQEEVDRCGGQWLEFMDSQERHHALASPEDVEAWCQSLIDNRSVATGFNYWTRINRFYDWLCWHVDHPHIYNPVLMAVIAGSASRMIWEFRLNKTPDYTGGCNE